MSFYYYYYFFFICHVRCRAYVLLYHVMQTRSVQVSICAAGVTTESENPVGIRLLRTDVRSSSGDVDRCSSAAVRRVSGFYNDQQGHKLIRQQMRKEKRSSQQILNICFQKQAHFAPISSAITFKSKKVNIYF